MIRPALARDAANIEDLWNGIIADTNMTFTTQLKSGADIKAIIADPNRLVQVAHHSDVFAGFALIGPFRSGPGYAYTAEHTIYLHDSAHGHGVGRALMQTLEREAAKAGYHAMVGALNGQNTDAFAFHTAIGFRQAGTLLQIGYKNGQWHDLILMQKILQSATDILGTPE